jgi:UV DNA damage endonuclease
LGVHRSKFKTAAVSSLPVKRKECAKMLAALWRHNLAELVKVLDYNIETGILLYRVSSEIFPLASHPRHRESWAAFLAAVDLSPCTSLVEKYLELGGRLTMHPKRFISLGSSSKAVRKKSVENLEIRSEILDLLGLPAGHFAPINIHLSNGRDGERALKRFYASLDRLSDRVRARLVFENEDKDYWTWQNILRHFPDFPVTLDSHHHQINNKGESLAEAVEGTGGSWGRCMPLRHLSDGDKGPHDRAHHEWVREIPVEFLRQGSPASDIEIEAKMKDMAVLFLKAKYGL